MLARHHRDALEIYLYDYYEDVYSAQTELLMLAGAGGLLLLLLVRRAAASSYGRVPRSAARTPWLAIAQTSTGPPGDLAYVVVRC